MTVVSVAVTPFAINGGKLQLGSVGSGNTYEQAISTFSLTPSINSSSLKSIAGQVYPFYATPEWTMALTFAQDPKTTTSLTNYLIANAGQVVAFLFTGSPGTTGAPTFSGNVLIVPGPLGGDMDKNLDASASLPLSGAPTVGVLP